MNAKEWQKFTEKHKTVSIIVTDAAEGPIEGIEARLTALIPKGMIRARLEIETYSEYGGGEYGRACIEGYVLKTGEDLLKEKTEREESDKKSLEYLERLAARHGKKIIPK